MEKYLKITQGLEAIEVKDVVIDMEKYKIFDASHIKEEDVLYTGKLRGKYKEYIKSYDYLDKVLKSGYGVFFKNVVYYMPQLQSDCFNKEIKDFKNWLSKIRKTRENKNLQFTDFLLDDRFSPLVENYISMYKLNLLSEDSVKGKLEGKVSDVEKVFDLCFSK